MSITSAIVLYASIWAVVFFMVLPQGVVSQQEDGEIVPGTPASAPTDAKIKRKVLITTAAAAVVFAVVYWVISERIFTLEDISILTLPSGR